MSIKKIITGLTLSMLLASGVAIAADFNKGLDAFNAGNFKTALAEWTPLAEQGDVYTQNFLGFTLSNGPDAMRDIKSAVKWYTKAAEQGYADAQGNLGVMYARGEGVLTDTKRAYMWFNLGSYNGSKNAGENKDIIAEDMTPADIIKAQDMSSACLESNYTDC